MDIPTAQSPVISAQAGIQNACVWFRRDLRLQDNAALYHALKHSASVYGVFVLDTDILQSLPRADRRVAFILESLTDLDAQMQAMSAGRARLIVLQGRAVDEIPLIAQRLGVQAVFANHDDEPQALARDAAVRTALQATGAELHTFKDHVVFERQEVLTQQGKPYTVFTPYKNAWLKKLDQDGGDFYLKRYPTEKYDAHWADVSQGVHAELGGLCHVPSLKDIGFEPTNLKALKVQTGASGAQTLLQDFLERIDRYQAARDFPAVKGPSYLSVHLRFGTVSIRELARLAYQRMFQSHVTGSAGAATWLSELIWRDFYAQILANFPHVVQGAFKPEYDRIEWESGPQAEALFAAWCEARTGYPLVDAAMRQLNQSGYMHNRLRMVVASFLTKDLGIDWRWGERYFAEKLIDFDLSANNGGWQWAASSGCDAQPYFRIFNPTTQSEKFDAEGKFIKRYMPELAHLSAKEIHLPKQPIVDHAQARLKTLMRYAVVKTAP
jgi:deoxyribodipyrimidine photo-lyase